MFRRIMLGFALCAAQIGVMAEVAPEAFVQQLSTEVIDAVDGPRTELLTRSLVRTLVLRCAARYMRNPDGYVTSRAGDETLTWSDIGASSV